MQLGRRVDEERADHQQLVGVVRLVGDAAGARGRRGCEARLDPGGVERSPRRDPAGADEVGLAAPVEPGLMIVVEGSVVV